MKKIINLFTHVVRCTPLAKIHHLLQSLFGVLTLALFGAPTYASLDADEIQIFDARPLQIIESATTFSVNAKTLSFAAFDRVFVLELSNNQQFISRLDGPKPPANLKLFKGHLANIDDSWARINQLDGRYSGVIFDGEQLFIIDTLDIVGSALSVAMQRELNNGTTDTVIFRAVDVVTSAVCGLRDHSHSASNLNAVFNELSNTARAATQQANIIIVTDPAYAASSNGDTRAQVLSQMNIVDGIFSEQIGVKIALSTIRELNNNAGMTSTNASQLLEQFRNYANNQFQNPGLMHLLTGRDMDGSVIGIAYLRALCSQNIGVGLTQAGGRGVTGALTAAHEFGHNFGAPHDNQNGSACVNTPGTFLMNPFINGSQTFSQCSRNQITPIVNNASCLVDIDDPGPSVVLNANFDSGTAEGFTYRDDIFNTDNRRYAQGFLSSTPTGRRHLSVALGGVDDVTIRRMSGGWSADFDLNQSRNVNLSLRYRLVQRSEYESGEFTEARFAIDGNQTALQRINGDGNGGEKISTGWVTTSVDLGVLAAGSHTLSLGGFNNKKNTRDEKSYIRFDDIVVTAN